VQIVVSRYQGDKKISSLPYALSVNANDGFIGPDGNYMAHGGPARLRTGAQVPVPSIAPPKDSPVQGAMGPIQYKTIGTNIDCTAHSTEDGRFRIGLSIEDTSVYADGQTAPGVQKINDIPSFRTFQSTNTVILRDGQSTEFTAAADKITGEVTKLVVTVNVVK
jgi:type II/III secretion system protein